MLVHMGIRITRRDALLAPAVAAQTTGSAPPNILLMLSDDHSFPFVGCYGSSGVKTPNLDRFAGEGMRFDSAFTAAPQCVPSRTAIVTGRSPVAARVGRFSSPLPADVPALPDLLRKQGYFTGVARRYFHLDGVVNAGPSTAPVYDKHSLRTFQRRVDFYDRGGSREQTVPVFEKFLDQAKGKPFLMWMNFSDPHHVWDRTGAHDPASIKVPGWLPDLPGVRDDLSRYFDEINRVDDETQGLLNLLKQRGLDSNTLVIFMGDNGMAFPHGKGSLYDPGLHVPLMARWPGRIKAGMTVGHLVSGEDITPTLLEAAGGSPLPEMSGRSFLPLLLGKDYQPRQYIFGQRLYHGNSPLTENTKSSEWDLGRCVRSTRHKLIFNATPWMEYAPTDSARDPGWQQMVKAHQDGKLNSRFDRAYFRRPRPIWELYDLAADPDEMNNLAGTPALAEIEKELKTALHETMILDFDFLPLPFGPQQ